MRIRTIKPGFFLNEDLAALPAFVRLAFVGLWTLADREGRLEDRPVRIKAQLFPYEPKADVEGALEQLATGGFIERYEVDGARYVQVLGFAEHQRPNVREPASTIPERVSNARIDLHVHARAETAPRSDVEVHALHDHTAAPLGNGSGEGEGNGSGEGISYCCEPAEPDSQQDALVLLPASQARALMTFPVVGKGRTWDLTEVDLLALREGFPALDAEALCREARAWCHANPTKLKTAGGMPRFLFTWFSNAQNRGGGRGARALPGQLAMPARDQRNADSLADWAKRTGGIDGQE